MADPDRIARIRTYLEQHRDMYDREALRQQLIADGHDPEALDLAMAQVYGLQVEPQAIPANEQNPSFNTTLFALMIIGTIVLNMILLCGAFALAVNFTTTGTQVIVALVLTTITPLLLEGVAVLALRQRNRVVARGLMWGLITTVVLLMLGALLIGTCIALLSGTFG